MLKLLEHPAVLLVISVAGHRRIKPIRDEQQACRWDEAPCAGGRSCPRVAPRCNTQSAVIQREDAQPVTPHVRAEKPPPPVEHYHLRMCGLLMLFIGPRAGLFQYPRDSSQTSILVDRQHVICAPAMHRDH